MPEALTRLVDRILPSQRALAKVLVPVVGRAAALPAPGREVGPALLRLRDQLAGAMAVLRSERTSVRIVLTPEAVVLAEARRTLTALALQGFVVDGAVANRVIPADGRLGLAARLGERAAGRAGAGRRVVRAAARRPGALPGRASRSVRTRSPGSAQELVGRRRAWPS